MPDAPAPYGWSGLRADGTGPVFTLGGVPTETAMTGLTIYAAAADYLAALATANASLIPFAVVQANKAAALKGDCAAAITAGFLSSALGAPHTYPSTVTDQQNLLASVTASLLPGVPANWTTPFWCADANGAWAYVPHSVTAIQQVGLDAKQMVLAAQAKLQGLQAKVAAAPTQIALDAITWA